MTRGGPPGFALQRQHPLYRPIPEDRSYTVLLLERRNEPGRVDDTGSFVGHGRQAKHRHTSFLGVPSDSQNGADCVLDGPCFYRRMYALPFIGLVL